MRRRMIVLLVLAGWGLATGCDASKNAPAPNASTDSPAPGKFESPRKKTIY